MTIDRVDRTDRTDRLERELGGCPAMHLDFTEPAEAGTYWALADELREQGPAHFDTVAQGFWVFTRHDAVREIYGQPGLFSSESFTPWDPDPVYRFVPTQIDPPEHVKYRQILNPWFSPGAVSRAEPRAREICRRLVSELAPRGGCDFVADFALRYPTEVFLAVMGMPVADADRFLRWVDDFFAGLGGDPAAQEGMVAALTAIRQYWADAVEERRGSPPRDGDLASHLLHARVDDRPLNDTEILDMLTVLVLAGLDTTRGQLGYLFRHLATTEADRRRLVADPSLAPLAVEESLRVHTITFGDGRKVTADTEFHGCPLKKGDMVYGLVASANRDPRVYDRADEFVIDRTGSHHFGFAGGPHRCLGAHLARREMQVALEEWHAIIPQYRLVADDPLRERGGGSMLALQSLPLVWDLPD
jgi:cytochrome P450